MSATKTCRKCRKTKPLTEFRQDSKIKDGRRGTCKFCEGNGRRISGWRGPVARLPRGIDL